MHREIYMKMFPVVFSAGIWVIFFFFALLYILRCIFQKFIMNVTYSYNNSYKGNNEGNSIF